MIPLKCVHCNLFHLSEFIDNFEIVKRSTTKQVLNRIKSFYETSKSSILIAEKNATQVQSIIDSTSISISVEMTTGLIKLAELSDTDFEKILPEVFDDPTIEKTPNVQLVLKEAKEIYETGNQILDDFQDIVDGF